MTKKELSQLHYLNKEIDKLITESQLWRERAEKMTQTISDMPHGSDGENPREVAICKMIDCETKANELIDKLYNLKQNQL